MFFLCFVLFYFFIEVFKILINVFFLHCIFYQGFHFLFYVFLPLFFWYCWLHV
jgi:hypothetical protein